MVKVMELTPVFFHTVRLIFISTSALIRNWNFMLVCSNVLCEILVHLYSYCINLEFNRFSYGSKDRLRYLHKLNKNIFSRFRSPWYCTQ